MTAPLRILLRGEQATVLMMGDTKDTLYWVLPDCPEPPLTPAEVSAIESLVSRTFATRRYGWNAQKAALAVHNDLRKRSVLCRRKR